MKHNNCRLTGDCKNAPVKVTFTKNYIYRRKSYYSLEFDNLNSANDWLIITSSKSYNDRDYLSVTDIIITQVA